jgi:hypothetical protein
MWSEMLRPPAAAALLSAALAVAQSAGAGEVSPAVQGVALTDEFPLTAVRGTEGLPARPPYDPAGQSGADSLIADQPPAVVPLPPPLATGLAGLAGMAVFRVGRRVYRRR